MIVALPGLFSYLFFFFFFLIMLPLRGGAKEYSFSVVVQTDIPA